MVTVNYVEDLFRFFFHYEFLALTYETVGGFAAVTEALQHGIAYEVNQHLRYFFLYIYI